MVPSNWTQVSVLWSRFCQRDQQPALGQLTGCRVVEVLAEKAIPFREKDLISNKLIS